MLHTNEAHCSLALWAMQLEPERSNCTKRIRNGLCAGCQHWSSALVVKLAERISATIGQENGQENNRRNVEQF